MKLKYSEEYPNHKKCFQCGRNSKRNFCWRCGEYIFSSYINCVQTEQEKELSFNNYYDQVRYENSWYFEDELCQE